MKTKTTPADFLNMPMSSVLKKAEPEFIARNIMVILNRTGNIFRELSWDEYMKERKKDTGFSTSEKDWFDKVIDYCTSPHAAASFSDSWRLPPNIEVNKTALKHIKDPEKFFSNLTNELKQQFMDEYVPEKKGLYGIRSMPSVADINKIWQEVTGYRMYGTLTNPEEKELQKFKEDLYKKSYDKQFEN